MSDPIPVRISQLPSTNTFNDSDDIVLVQSGATVRTALANITTQTAPVNGDDYLVIRSNQLFKIDAANLPVRAFTGQIISIMGNVQNPSTAFPNFCMTNFEGSTSISETNWSVLVPYLRGQQLIYLEGQTGAVSQFSGTVAGSELTLDTNTANDDLLAALDEDLAAFGGVFTSWRTVDINGTTFDITAIDSATRVITVSGSPSVGVQNAIFYPHRIAGSTTTARLISWRGRSPVGTGTTQTISGLLRRDRMQGHYHQSAWSRGSGSTLAIRAGANNADITTIGNDTEFQVREPETDTVNGAPRTGIDTHGPDFATHMYIYGGTYSP